MSVSGTPSQSYSHAVVASAAEETGSGGNSTSSSSHATVVANTSQSNAARQVTEAVASGQVLGQGALATANAEELARLSPHSAPASIPANESRKRRPSIPAEVLRDLTTRPVRGDQSVRAERNQFPTQLPAQLPAYAQANQLGPLNRGPAQRIRVPAARQGIGFQQWMAAANTTSLPQDVGALHLRSRGCEIPGVLAPPMLRPAARYSEQEGVDRAAVLGHLPEAMQQILNVGDYFSNDGLRPGIGESPELLAALRNSVQGNERDLALLQCYLKYRHELDGVTPIHFACNNAAALAIMIEIFEGKLDQLREAILTCTDCRGVTPLCYAVERDNLPLVVDLFQDDPAALRRAMLYKGDLRHPGLSSSDGAAEIDGAFADDLRELHSAIIAIGGYFREDLVGYAPIGCINERRNTMSAAIDLFKYDPNTLIRLCEGLLAATDHRGAPLFDVIGINDMLELAPGLLTAADNRGRTVVHLLSDAGRATELAIVLNKLNEQIGLN